jgi:hypothetical protein
MEIIKSNKLYFNKGEDDCIKEYYDYIKNLFITILNDVNMIDIVLPHGQYSVNFKNTLIKVGINYEHTLVKNGGRSSEFFFKGEIPLIDNESEKYLVRICNYNDLNDSDIVIDYSIPNIINISSSNELKNFLNKIVYISPSILPLDLIKNQRNILCMTSFLNNNEFRRKKLLDDLKENNISNFQLENCFLKNDLQKILKNTKILINIHQTDYHHTCEELRILPALLCGVIVISENSPLKENIPYSKYIIWTDYKDIIKVVKDIILNYEFYYESIFKDVSVLENLHVNNLERLKNKCINESLLNNLSFNYKLDKNININYPNFHNYIPSYNHIFKNIRKNIKKFLEIGIGSIENGQMSGVIPFGYQTGNSLRCWRDYFENAQIFGIDIFYHNIIENRIRTFQADQSNEEQLTKIIEEIGGDIDIIIDDGSHNSDHQTKSFLYLEKYLKQGGIYVIEDIQPHFIETIKTLSNFDVDFQNYIKNNYIVEFYDTRSHFNRLDDFMVVFIKK